jgi:hypothetical protein
MDEQDATLITNLAWGQMEVTAGGQVSHFKDCKVWTGGATAWNWNETGTQHEPGIQPADLEEVLEKGVEIVILARGVFSRLGVCPETEKLLRDRGVEYHMLDTKEAITLYNELARQGRRVGGVFHSTC